MDSIKEALSDIGLNSDNSVVIGSGILSALNIRSINDIDVLVSNKMFDKLSSTGHFELKSSHGKNVLVSGDLEIRNSWSVLEENWNLDRLVSQSEIIKGVRYITLDFLFRVKKDWAKGASPRQKDLRDVEMIRSYLNR